jgi:hypothetical protein
MNLVKPETINSTGSITRSTTGTYFDSSGIMQTAAINAVRITHNPDTKEFLGVLIENASTNLLTYSEQFDNAAWGKIGGATATPNTLTTPNGTLTADTLTVSQTKQIQGTVSSAPAGTYCFSAYYKTNGSVGVYHQMNCGGTGATVAAVGINFTTGTISTRFGTPVSSGIEAVGNGWFRVWLVGTHVSGSVAVYVVSSTTPDDSVFSWGAQLELGSKPTSYIPTVASQVTRAADIITGSGLVYTNVTNAFAEWSSATTYALGTSVSYGIDGTYISLQNSNLNQNPLTATTYWSRTGPTNKMAAFDDQVSSVTTATSDIIFAVTAPSIDTVALLNVTAAKTSIAVSDASSKSLVYHNSQQLTGAESLDWFSYFFYDEDTVRTTSVYMDIPILSNALITVKISGTGTVSIGNFVTGEMKVLGNTQYGVSAGIIDYSRKDVDEFGNVTFVKRNFSKRINASVSLTNANLNKVQRILYQLRATPVLWLASTDIQFEEPLIIYGFYRDFSTEISYPTHSLCNLQIEGLI